MDLTNLFFIVAIIYIVSSIFYILRIIIKKEILEKTGIILTSIGFLVHTIALILWTVKAKHAPFANLYESTVFFSWAIILLYLFFTFKYKFGILGILLVPLSFLVIGAASVLPEGYKDITPLVPALQSMWLEIHVITCMLGYAFFAISFIVSIIFLFKEKFTKNKFFSIFPDNLIFDNINYKAVALGLLFLSFGIISGAVWANFAWGTYWSWDPKETWSLITWIIYAIYLHARLLKKWQGKKLAILLIIGFLAVLFTYWGVNLILSGLHSYSK